MRTFHTSGSFNLLHFPPPKSKDLTLTQKMVAIVNVHVLIVCTETKLPSQT